MKASTQVKSVKPLPVWYRAKDRGERLRREEKEEEKKEEDLR